MKKILWVLYLIFLFVFDLNAKELLTWQVVHWPPFQMLEGPDKGHGRYDALLELYIANLPQYEHKTATMNWARFWNEIKEGKKICNMFAIKTDQRAAYSVFSRPLSIGLPIRIIMRKSSIETLGSQNPISIIALLKDRRFRGLLIEKRSYYPTIDKFLNSDASFYNVKRLALPEESIIQMVLAGRADYTLEYSYVAHYIASRFQTEHEESISSIPIKEIQNFGQSCLACPNNEWGRKIVADFDKMLHRIKSAPEYLKILQMYHTDPKELEAIQQGFETIILKAE